MRVWERGPAGRQVRGAPGDFSVFTTDTVGPPTALVAAVFEATTTKAAGGAVTTGQRSYSFTVQP
ncbi:hypothetical protein [Saccharothrix sp. HUAS TT1]|uniref:hypothetical protein n=1 Tax=unclassified Saccharothrix TaxID=2593673 RepID=UPI00345BCEF7